MMQYSPSTKSDWKAPGLKLNGPALVGLLLLTALLDAQGVKDVSRSVLHVAGFLAILWVAHQSGRKLESVSKSTEQEACEEKLIVSLVPDPILALDSEERIVFLNQAARTSLGVSEAVSTVPSFSAIQLKGQTLDELLEVGRDQLIRTSLIGRDAKPWPVEIHLRTVNDHPSLRYVAAIRTIPSDLSQQEPSPELDFNFYQAQKMEAVGLLAGGVAHDFNNLLAVIGGSAEDLSDEGDRGEMVKRISQAVNRAKTTTRHLLTFSRRHLNASESIELGEVYEATMVKVSGILPEGLFLHWTREPGDYRVFLNREHSRSLLYDLLLNARDAIAGSGDIRASLTLATLDKARAWAGGSLVPGDYALLVINDDGCGMAKETQARVFEPFFTTKSDDLKSGFGLASVYGIVKAAGGGIIIDSKVGVGTRVQVFLPIQSLDNPAMRNVEKGKSERKSSARTGLRVALVEDEQALRSLLERTLTRAGYVVESAANGADAVEAFLSRADDFDILVTDVVMPKLRGPAVARRLREAHPHLQVIFMSGFTDGALDDIDPENDLFLQKPFSPGEFLRALKELTR
ncbi:MAG: response regulator [Candidatus Eremiobacteraeota bacterium]|nr:response regulator [Candidatus Eremiobacteraeota bacterium]